MNGVAGALRPPAGWRHRCGCRRPPSACAFSQESFGALHQMLAGLSDNGRAEAWREIEMERGRFEGPNGYEGPCELLIAAGTK